MSDLAWAVKNGDLDQVKELVDNKVILTCHGIQYHISVVCGIKINIKQNDN